MPTIEAFAPRELGPKDWGTELLVARTAEYSGKVLIMRAGTKGPLQYHQWKDETFYLFSGEASVRYVVDRERRPWESPPSVLRMQAGMSIHVPPGAIHQVEAITECVFFEASTPVFEDRVNVEQFYP